MRLLRPALVAALLLAAACREDVATYDLTVPLPKDGFADDAGDGGAAPLCSSSANCLTCCTAEFESGALDFTAAMQPCACQPQVCQSACAATLCGTSLVLDAACRACLDGARAPGGACHQADSDCVATQGACGAFEGCLDRCPR